MRFEVVDCRTAVVIPSYRVADHILGVIAAIGPEVDRIYVVDDRCPDGSGSLVEQGCDDRRVTVIFHETNLGVGGAVMSGYRAAIADGMDIIVKIDGDGQMDPGLIGCFVRPIIDGEADYTKGNRFFDLEAVRAMPRVRLFGNALLSFMNKLSSGYWNLFDPTNGYTATTPMWRGTCLSKRSAGVTSSKQTSCSGSISFVRWWWTYRWKRPMPTR